MTAQVDSDQDFAMLGVRWGDPMEADAGARFVLPIGTVTLMLADVEGSTRGWESEPARMRDSLAEHDRIVAEELENHGGVRPRDQGEGDAFVAAFARASDAVACALALQLRLADEVPGLRLRIGVHTGEVELRDAANYAGSSINRCARLRDIAHGGQVVISQTTRDLVGDAVTAVDLGVHRLKDLAQPERVWQLCHPKLRSEFPPLRSLDAYRHNLPSQLTTLVGRRDEVAAVRAALRDSRLVTLSGAGGSGKTRLALQVAAESLDDFPHGVWFADLSPLTSTEAVATRVALAVQLSHDQAPFLARSLGSLDMLIVLDNCEHLIDACAELAAELLGSCPNLRILATSREILDVPGETAFRVPSLSLPTGESPSSPAALAQSEAVRLFIDRAAKARPNFRITEENAPAVAEICHRLDGIPLAIELAAARVRVLTPQQIATGLIDRFKMLGGGARTVMPRQQTLRASVDWSYRLLTEQEQRLLCRLSVFPGGATLDAAEAVVAGDGLDAAEVLDLLTRLADKSLVIAEEAGAATRYRMLETIRQYAMERHADVAGAETVERRFVEYFCQVCDISWRDLQRADGFDLIASLHTDWENIQSAFDTLLAGGDVVAAANTLMGLTWVLGPLGRFDWGLEMFDRVGAALGSSDAVLAARITIADAAVRANAMEPGACAAAERAVAASNQLPDDDESRLYAHYVVAAAHTVLDPPRSLAAFDDGIALAERVMPDAVEILRAMRCTPLAQLGRIDEAREVIAEMLASATNHESPMRTAQLWPAGATLMTLGDFVGARGLFEATIPGLDRYPCKQPLQWTYDFLSRCCFELGALDDARAYARSGIEVSQASALLSGNYGYLHQRLALVAEAEGDFSEAVRWAHDAMDYLSGLSANAHEAARGLALEATLIERVGDHPRAQALFIDALNRARALQPEVRPNYLQPLQVPLALPFDGLARLAAVDGQFVRAARLAGAASRRHGIEPPMAAWRRDWHAETLAPAHRELGARWAAEVAIGESLTDDDAVAYALGGADVDGTARALLLADRAEAGDAAGRDEAISALRAAGWLAPLGELLARGGPADAVEAVQVGAELGDPVLVAAALRRAAHGRDDAATMLKLATDIAAGTEPVERAATYVAKRKGRRVRPTSGWESLTPVELQVVDLVAQGLTNRQIGDRLFISPRTVQGHLARIFPKVDASSRAELAALVGRRPR